jgi:hypothetical protein
MFVSHDVTLPVSFGVATARAAELLRRRALDAASEQSYGDGITVLLRVGPLGSVSGVSRLVEARFRDLVMHGDMAVLTLRWEASGQGGGLFPALDADITLVPADADTTKLRLDGTYRPPLGAFGERLDRAILHRVATATIQSFVAQVATAITDPASVPGPDPVVGQPCWDAPA